VIHEAVVAEHRAQQLDMAARAVFAQDGDFVRDSRFVLAEELFEEEITELERVRDIARSASVLNSAASADMFEVA
jgi:hypothetical protein